MVSVSLIRSGAIAIALCALAMAGCKSTPDGDGGGGAGTPLGGFGGAGIGAAGVGGAGVGGAGIGGAGVGGAGVGGAGIGGAGAGGAAAGVGGSAGSAAPVVVAGCETAVAGDAVTLHAAASEVLTLMTPCGFSSCHAGTGKANLILTGATNLAMLMVDKQAALDRSYLWIKLTGAADASGFIQGDMAVWGMGGACGQTAAAPYGVRMPQMATAATTSEERLAKIRNWICGGAPAPM